MTGRIQLGQKYLLGFSLESSAEILKSLLSGCSNLADSSRCLFECLNCLGKLDTSRLAGSQAVRDMRIYLDLPGLGHQNFSDELKSQRYPECIGPRFLF